MATRVQITKAGDGRTVAGFVDPVRAGETVAVDARTAAALVAAGTALYTSAHDEAA